MMPDTAWVSSVPEHLRHPVARMATPRHALPSCAMQLLMQARAPGEAERALEDALRELRAADPDAEAALTSGLALLRANPAAWQIVHDVAGLADHGRRFASADAAAAYWARTFDRIAALSADAGAGLYALGNPDLLRGCTQEIVGFLRARALVTPETEVVDIGCGNGRFEAALSPFVARIIGLDVSAAMIACAEARCAGLPNVRLIHASGRDLRAIETNAADLVLAVDSFPYLVTAGPRVARDHIGEAARVLRPGGILLILNYSYRGRADLDDAEIAAGAARYGLHVRERRSRPFAQWDGEVYALQRHGCGRPAEPDRP